MEITKYSNLTTPIRLDQLIESFIESQDVMRSSRALYLRTIKQYINWVEETNRSMGVITRVDIIAYKEDLLTKGLSSLTVGSYLSVVRKFYEWTESTKNYPNVAKGIKTPKRKQMFKKLPLVKEQASLLLSYFKTLHEDALESELRARDYAIVNLLLRTGLRTIEAAGAIIEDVTFKQGKRVLLVQGKGEVEKNNFVILTDKAYEPIRKYLGFRPAAKQVEPLFTSLSNNSKSKQLTTRSVSKIVKEGLKAINLDSKHLTAHSLRHTLAVNILLAGGTLTEVQGVLRHANPATTQVYTRSIDETIRLRDAAEERINTMY